LIFKPLPWPTKNAWKHLSQSYFSTKFKCSLPREEDESEQDLRWKAKTNQQHKVLLRANNEPLQALMILPWHSWTTVAMPWRTERPAKLAF
jgi:hypothetical protein